LSLNAEPSRSAGLDRLDGFVERAGGRYAARRKFDLGPGRHDAVSGLSPYIRHRLITEEEVVRRVLERHTPEAAEKFIQEVFWRTYWKGWLELRPSVWTAYREAVRQETTRVASDESLARRLADAAAGRTGIACFDAWIRELNDTGYLHNHARMWVASIWIFTLRLPWELGAELFLSRLLDGDPASNTLSWHWVAGLQTRDKTYLARPDNIERFTEGRFHPAPGTLSETAIAVSGPTPPPPGPAPEAPSIPRQGRVGVLVHREDLSPEWLIAASGSTVVGLIRSPTGHDTDDTLPARFTAGALDDARTRLRQAGYDVDDIGRADDTIGNVEAWASVRDIRTIVTPHAPVGACRSFLDGLTARARAAGHDVIAVPRAWDTAAWPHATKGFFQFKRQIPALLDRLVD